MPILRLNFQNAESKNKVSILVNENKKKPMNDNMELAKCNSQFINIESFCLELVLNKKKQYQTDGKVNAWVYMYFVCACGGRLFLKPKRNGSQQPLQNNKWRRKAP